MINFKKELIEKRRVSDEKVSVYNSVINENLDNIKELFKDSEIHIDTKIEKNNSITLKVGKHKWNGDKLDWVEKDIFTYDYIFNIIYCNNVKENIELKLKNVIINIAQENYIEIKEDIKGYINLNDGNIVELSELEAKMIPIMNDDNETVKEYKGLVNFKLTEDYNETKLPKTFDIERFVDDESIQIKNCEIKKYDFTTQKYEAEYKIKDVDIKDQKEEMLSKFVNSAFEGLNNQEDRKYSIAFGRKSNNSPVYFNIKENGEEVNIKVELC